MLPKVQCLVRGHRQELYLEYNLQKLHTSVTQLHTNHVGLVMAALQVVIMKIIDISNAYLYGDVGEPSIMKQPNRPWGL